MSRRALPRHDDASAIASPRLHTRDIRHEDHFTVFARICVNKYSCEYLGNSLMQNPGFYIKYFPTGDAKKLLKYILCDLKENYFK